MWKAARSDVPAAAPNPKRQFIMLTDILNGKAKDIVSAPHTVRVATVVSLMSTHKVGAVAITDASGNITALVEEKAIVHGCAKYGMNFLEQPVMQHAAPPATCELSDSVSRVMRRMTQDRVRHLIVMDGPKIAGLVSIGDVVKARMRNADLEALVLRDLAQARLLASQN
jgi:CBS domain-containing protein